MKSKILFLACYVMFFVANGQIINLRWGGLNDGGNEFDSFFYAGQSKADSSQMITINGAGQVNLFDTTLNRMQHKDIMKQLKGDAVVATCREQKKWHVFSSATKGELYDSELDADAIAVKSNQLLYKFTAGGVLRMVVSPDSSKWAFYRTGTVNKKAGFEVAVVNNTGKLLYSKQMQLASAADNFTSVLITNQGAIAWVDNNGKENIFQQLDEKGGELPAQSLTIAAKKMHPAIGTVSGADFLFCIGYNRENINYDCFAQCELITLSKSTFLHKTVTMTNCLRDAVPMHCVARGDNSVLLVTEEFANTTTASSNTCRYGAINVINISVSTAAIVWQREIFKNIQFVTTPDKKSSPLTTEYVTLYSHNFFIFDTKLMFVYNDNCSNCMRQQQTPRTHADIRKSCLNMVAVDEKGELIRYANLAEPQSKYTVHLNNTIRINDKKVIVFGTNVRYMLGRLKLE